MKKSITIREYRRWLILGFLFLIGDIFLIVEDRIHPLDYYPYASWGAVSVLCPIIIIYLIIKDTKNKGTIKLNDNSITVKYFRRKEKCTVSLHELVYYTFFVDILDEATYIVISNQPIELNEYSIQYEIDYSRQIPIEYTKRVKKLLPMEGWIYNELKSEIDED